MATNCRLKTLFVLKINAKKCLAHTRGSNAIWFCTYSILGDHFCWNATLPYWNQRSHQNHSAHAHVSTVDTHVSTVHASNECTHTSATRTPTTIPFTRTPAPCTRTSYTLCVTPLLERNLKGKHFNVSVMFSLM